MKNLSDSDLTSRLPQYFWLICAAAFFYFYVPTLRMPIAFDEWIFYDAVDGLRVDGMSTFPSWLMSRVGDFWRPLTSLPFLAMTTAESMFWLQLGKLVWILGIGILLWRILRLLSISSASAPIWAGLYLIHQNIVHAAEPDWVGDTICTAAMLAVFWLALLASARSIRAGYYYLWGTICAIIALLSKEAGTATILIPLIVFVFRIGQSKARRERSHLNFAAVLLVIDIIYLAVRSMTGGGFESENPYYALRVGTNIISNIALPVLGLLNPVNTADVFFNEGISRILAAVWVIGLGSMMLTGFYRSETAARWRAVGMVILVYAVIGPAMLMPHIPEGQFARALPFGIMLAAILMQPVIERLKGNSRVVVLLVLICWIGFSGAAILEKVSDISVFHKKAQNFRQEVMRRMPDPPDRPIQFVAELTPKGYAYYRQPLWFALQAEIEIGLKHMYKDPSYRGRLYLTESFQSLPDSLKSADFFIDRFERLSTIPFQP
jgi:hypothetical protein